MNIKFKGLKLGFTRAIFCAFATLMLGSANANTVMHNFSSSTEKMSPGSISWGFVNTEAATLLDFDLWGYTTLDGYANGYTDMFHLFVNGSEIFTATFNLGGGGENKVLLNPYAGTAVTTTGSAHDDPFNSSETTWAGGFTKISIPINFLLGLNNIDFSYTGVGEGILNEAWSINNATVSSVSEPGIFALLGIGILGLFISRAQMSRRNSSSNLT